MANVCKICGKEYSERGLHSHVVKSHDRSVESYYEEFLPRFDKFTGEKIPYLDYYSYVEADFLSQENLLSWLRKVDKEEAKEYALKCLRARIEEKKLKYAPSYVEIATTPMMPPYEAYVYFFGSYKAACDAINMEPLLLDSFVLKELKKSNPIILIDTREQQPLSFKKTKEQKLSIGDYTLAGDDYTYTYVDRKAENDFKSTVTANQERFVRELERAVNLDTYLYVVVESDFEQIEKNNLTSVHQSNMKYVWASMRRIQHMFPRKTQFIFTGNRENSEKIIPYLLRYGKELWNVDVQYYLKNKGVL